MKALLFFVSHKRYNSSLPYPVLILRGVGFFPWRQIYAPLKCQHHSYPNLHLLNTCNQAQEYWDKCVYESNQDLYESWKFWSSVSELPIVYIKKLINKSLKLMLSCAYGVGLQPWRGFVCFGAIKWHNWRSKDPEPATRKTDCLKPAVGGFIQPSCTYFSCLTLLF